MPELLIERTMPSVEHDQILKEYFSKYLINVRGVKQSTVNHYLNALNTISARLKEKSLVENDIYEIDNLEQLNYVRDILYKDKDFVELDTRGNRMYSAGLNNYYRFSEGEEFPEIKEKIVLLDTPVKPNQKEKVSEREAWKRSGIMRTQIIKYAGYRCEIGVSHETFTAKSNNKPYMEGHHAIPIKLQEKFPNSSLDVYANLLCLCPVCHRKIHYGVDRDRRQMMDQIYDYRADRLANSGIRLSKSEFSEMVALF